MQSEILENEQTQPNQSSVSIPISEDFSYREIQTWIVKTRTWDMWIWKTLNLIFVIKGEVSQMLSIYEFRIRTPFYEIESSFSLLFLRLTNMENFLFLSFLLSWNTQRGFYCCIQCWDTTTSVSKVNNWKALVFNWCPQYFHIMDGSVSEENTMS